MADGGHLESMWNKHWGRPTCDVGPCTAGMRCDLKDNGCDYFDDYRRACDKQLVSTNYAYWIAINRFGQGLGKFDMLVLDECHSSPDQLSSAMSAEFTHKDFKELGTKPPKIDAPLQSWRMWGRVQLQRVTGKIDFFTRGAKIGATVGGVFTFTKDSDLPDATELKFWKKLEGKCKTLSESSDDWIIESDENNGNIRIAPAWVRKYAESNLFMGIPRVVLMSATVRPKTAELLDIPESEYDFIEYPSTFPVERRPIYWLPTLALNYNTEPNDMRTWVVCIDRIISKYAAYGLKGIIHTVSYQKQHYILEYSRFRSIMHANTSGDTRDVVKSFRACSGPAILVSPSVGTGFDFPFEQSRFQIIAKLPFRDMRSNILKMQSKQDPEYSNYLTAQDLLQYYGRINRDPADVGHTWIIDSNFEWFQRKRTFFPQYFLDAIIPVSKVDRSEEHTSELQ